MFAGHCLHKKSRQVILMRENKFEKVYKFGAAYPVHNISIEFYSLICNYYIVKNLTHMSAGEGGGRIIKKKLILGGSAPRSDPLPSYIPFLAEKTPLYYTLL